jgi:hypothetical protein
VVLKGHSGAVRSVHFSHDTRHLITGSDDKTAKVTKLTIFYIADQHFYLCVVDRFGLYRIVSSCARYWGTAIGSVPPSSTAIRLLRSLEEMIRP